ncbi:hypothetical protein AB6A40_011133 [Gnathostoma spinigerum]|uniref:Uncharacterized protein n=1 Tax=Gnathostoma spinigerum TaxID=75299 RepID=A0ABD6F2V2_9BILA
MRESLAIFLMLSDALRVVLRDRLRIHRKPLESSNVKLPDELHPATLLAGDSSECYHRELMVSSKIYILGTGYKLFIYCETSWRRSIQKTQAIGSTTLFGHETNSVI